MEIEQPYGELWRAVVEHRPYPGTVWPSEPEDRIAKLGHAWTEAGNAFVRHGTPREDMPSEAWQDAAGDAFRAKAAGERQKLGAMGERLLHAGTVVNGFAEDLVHTKTTITNWIRDNEATYDSLRTWVFWPDDKARKIFAKELADKVVQFNQEMIQRVAGRK